MRDRRSVSNCYNGRTDLSVKVISGGNSDIQGVEEKMLISTIHCNPFLVIDVRDLQSFRRNTSVQPLL